jgi:hypothetical protein
VLFVAGRHQLICFILTRWSHLNISADHAFVIGSPLGWRILTLSRDVKAWLLE